MILPKCYLDKYKQVVDEIFMGQLAIDFTLHFLNEVDCTCSTNSYSGPQFHNNRCYYCETGKYEEQTQTIKLRFYPNKKHWIKTTADSADAVAQVIGFIKDIPDIKNCQYLSKNSDGLIQKFKLSGEPQSHGFGHDRYFTAFLRQQI